MKRALTFLLAFITLTTGVTLAAGLSPEIHRRLSDIRKQMDAGKHRESLPRLRKLLRDPQADGYAAAVIRQHLGYAYLATERLVDARRELTTALASKTLPEEVNHELRRLLAQIALRLDNSQQALTYLKAWLQHAHSPTADERAMAAQIYYAAGQPNQAIDQLQQAIAMKRPVPGSWQRSLLGMYFETKRYQAARRLLRRLIQAYPGQADYWKDLAQVELLLGRHHQALEVMALAYLQGMLKSEELINFAHLHAAVGMPEQAARLLQQWRKSDRLPIALKRLRTEAQLWLMARERKQALALFEQASRRSENGRDDLARGRILFDAARWQESARALQRAIQRSGLKNPHQAQLLLGIAALQTGDKQLAQHALQQAIKSSDTRQQAESWLAVIDAKMTLQEQGGPSSIRRK